MNEQEAQGLPFQDLDLAIQQALDYEEKEKISGKEALKRAFEQQGLDPNEAGLHLLELTAARNERKRFNHLPKANETPDDSPN